MLHVNSYIFLAWYESKSIILFNLCYKYSTCMNSLDTCIFVLLIFNNHSFISSKCGFLMTDSWAVIDLFVFLLTNNTFCSVWGVEIYIITLNVAFWIKYQLLPSSVLHQYTTFHHTVLLLMLLMTCFGKRLNITSGLKQILIKITTHTIRIQFCQRHRVGFGLILRFLKMSCRRPVQPLLIINHS